jgi:hypothetical protein
LELESTALAENEPEATAQFIKPRLSRRNELAGSHCEVPFEAGGDSDTNAVLVFQQIFAYTIPAQPEVLDRVGVRWPTTIDGALGKTEQPPLAMIKGGRATGVGAL